MVNKIKFGPAVSSKNGDPIELTNYLSQALSFSDEAIELSLTKIDKIGNSITEEVLSLLNKFKYKSIHLPVVNNGDFISYPDKSVEESLKIIDGIIGKISINVVLIHPDQVRDFDWAKSRYGSLLAFENMDSKKKFGKTLEEMMRVFKICPKAKWVFDVNHLYTNDKSMKSSNDFFSSLSDRLTHYHISGYGGFHDALCLSKEDIILKGIKSLDCPIIDEGNLLEKGVLEKEYKYISTRLSFLIN